MELFVARQPIFDRSGALYGYELLYRRGTQSFSADGVSTDQMSLDVIIQSFLEIGLDRITHGKPGFLNFSRETFLGGSWELLDPRSVVIELLEDVEVDDEVIEACRRLRSTGHRLALDDFVAGGQHEALLDLAHLVKLDVLNRPFEEIEAVVAPLRARGVTLLAERVETMEVHEACKQMGFSLFQGYFYSRPELIMRKGMSAEQTAVVELLNLLRDEETADSAVEMAFRRNPALSYKLLRMVNSAAQGGVGIESILHAIRYLGRATVHRWLSLLLASSLAARGGMDAERVHSALLRARLCERLGETSGRRARSGPLFMVGLFSRMDALLGTPMEEILEKISLADEVRSALLGRGGPYGGWLRLAELYEAGEWEPMTSLAAELGVSPLEMPALYLDALSWTQEQIALAA